MKKMLAVLVMTGCMTLSSVGSVFAAGLGVVDFTYLEQHHPHFASLTSQYQASVKKYQMEFNEKSKKMTNKQKQTMINDYNAKLNQQRITLFRPMDQEVLNTINTVRVRKGLDYVAAKGYVFSGSGIVDITNDVAAQLAKIK